MIFISSATEDKELSKNDLLLLQKACHKASEEAKQIIYDLRVYYKTDNELLVKLKDEVDSYQKLRMVFEDLEDL